MIVEAGHYALVVALALALFNSVVLLWGVAARRLKLASAVPQLVE
ncbi:MAG: hypothetical protein WCF20_13470 [Methylovirgula sp.]